MNKFFVFTMLLSAVCASTYAADPVTAAVNTASQSTPVTAGTVKVTETPAVMVDQAVEAVAASASPVTPSIPMPTLPDTVAPIVEAPAPILGAAPASPQTAVIGATQTSADVKPATPEVVATPAITTPLPSFDANPLCNPVAAMPAAGVEATPAQPVVAAPRTIPLSVDLAGALGIRGFENIKSEGPIGFITVDDKGRVMFEGKDLTSNAQALCASGQPIPMMAETKAMPATAPDGSAYSDMPGQKGFRMQPIIDGPSYKYPPKKKKAKSKPKADIVKEDTMEPVTSAPVNSESSTMMKSSETPVSAEGLAVDAPATTGVVPMPAAVPADSAPIPTTDTSGEGAVNEVLGNGTETKTNTGAQ